MPPPYIVAGGDVTIILCPHAQQPHGRFTFSLGQFTTTGDAPMAMTLPVDAPIDVQVTWVDEDGNVTTVDGPTTWASADDTIVTVTVNTTDSTQAVLDTPPGAQLLTTEVTASADADRGSGVTTIIAKVQVTVVAGQAVSGTISEVPS